jgi:hypothetical protein
LLRRFLPDILSVGISLEIDSMVPELTYIEEALIVVVANLYVIEGCANFR